MNTFNIPPNETRRWTGPYLGNYSGLLWKTFNIDLDREEGKISIKDEIIEILSDDNEIKIDYIAVVDKNTFDNVDVIRNGIIICIAIFVGNTRLIDNLIVE